MATDLLPLLHKLFGGIILEQSNCKDGVSILSRHGGVAASTGSSAYCPVPPTGCFGIAEGYSFYTFFPLCREFLLEGLSDSPSGAVQVSRGCSHGLPFHFAGGA